MAVLHQVGRGDSFGLVAGLGIRRMKRQLVEEYGADRGIHPAPRPVRSSDLDEVDVFAAQVVLVPRGEGQALRRGLGDEHAAEGIALMRRQLVSRSRFKTGRPA